MSNQDNSESGFLIKLVSGFLAFLVGIVPPSCGNSIIKNVDDLIRFGVKPIVRLNFDDYVKIYGDDIARIIASTNSDDIVKLFDDILLIRTPGLSVINTNKNTKNIFIANKNRFREIDIKNLKNDTLIISNTDNYLIIGQAKQRGLKQRYLDEITSGRSSLIIPDTIRYDDLDTSRKFAIQQAADRAAQNAVKNALSQDVNEVSLEALTEITQNAALQEGMKQTGYSAIVFVTAVEMEAIVNQSINKALEENTNNEV